LNLLDRHIFKNILITCLGAVGLFSFVVALGNFYRDLLGPLLAGQLTIMMLLRLLLLLLPFAVSYALPMGILTGVLLTLGRLSADSEITAMRSAGIGIIRIARPVFILGVIGALVALYVNFESMPWARVQYHREFATALRANPLSFIVPKTFIRDFKGMVVYVGARDEAGGLHDLWIWELDNESRVKRLIRAESGRLDYDEATNSLVPTLFRAKSEERDPDRPEDFSKSPKAPSVEKAEEVRLSLDRYLAQNVFHVKPEWLRYGALQDRRAELAAQKPVPGQEKSARIALMKLTMIIDEKFNLALAVFTFAFVAVPLAIKVSRRETSANLGVAVVLVLGYYLLINAIKGVDGHPEYRPDILLWLPNVLFLWFGFWLIRRVQHSTR
jgi:lipopolysaccharide export system permease protein